MKHLKTFESFNENTDFSKDSLREMGRKVWDLITKDDRVVDSFVWGSFFEKQNPKDINIVVKLNTTVGQFDDKIKQLSELQKSYITDNLSPLDLTIVDNNDEAYLLFGESLDIEESPERTDSYNNIDDTRPIKKLKEMY